MAKEQNKNLIKCINFLSKVDIPVLKQTARSLAELCKDEDKICARSVAHIVKRDPLMTVKLMRYLQFKKRRAQQHEVMEVEQVLMMLGLNNALEKVPANPMVEDVLSRKQIAALTCMLRVTHRAHLASAYAYDWAVRLSDLHYEEVRIAALLHDIAEILMWCFGPAYMLQIRELQQKDKAMRSNVAQEKVLGFNLHQLQLALSIKWNLPKLLVTLMDDDHAEHQRVRNVILAVNLARHSANGWDDAALPDDYNDIGRLLNLQPEEVMTIVGADEQANLLQEVS